MQITHYGIVNVPILIIERKKKLISEKGISKL